MSQFPAFPAESGTFVLLATKGEPPHQLHVERVPIISWAFVSAGVADWVCYVDPIDALKSPNYREAIQFPGGAVQDAEGRMYPNLEAWISSIQPDLTILPPSRDTMNVSLGEQGLRNWSDAVARNAGIEPTHASLGMSEPELPGETKVQPEIPHEPSTSEKLAEAGDALLSGNGIIPPMGPPVGTSGDPGKPEVTVTVDKKVRRPRTPAAVPVALESDVADLV